jgi:predicted oxidoreductase
VGRTGMTVGAISFGCWRFAGADLATADVRINTAVDHGMTLIDTADVYGVGEVAWGAAETLLGDVLAAAPGLRDRIVLATKGGIQLTTGIGRGVPYDSSPQQLREACDASLRRLRTDVIDLYQIHRPDLLAHPADVAATLAELVTSGKVRFLGVSNHTVAQVSALQAHLPAGIELHTVQPEMSAIHLDPIDDGVLDQAMEQGMTPLAWSPLGGGRLASDEPTDAATHAVRRLLDELAARHGASRTQVALAFLLAHPAGVVPIIGTGNHERIAEAAAAVDVKLAKDDCYRIIAAAGRALP